LSADVSQGVALSGWAVNVPGFDLAALVPGERPSRPVAPEDASDLLGRRGLLAMEAATRLALCAVHRALGLGPQERLAGHPDPATAVVVSSNYGNVGAVAKIAATLHRGEERVSPLQAPNASSNVIASTVAIWFRCGGPNLMVCSGATGGLDAAALAAVLLRAERAERVILVGVEPDDDVAGSLHALRRTTGQRERLRAGAAAVVLERSVADMQAPRLGPVSSCTDSAAATLGSGADVLLGPSRSAPPGVRAIDLRHDLGDMSGADGVVQLALAAALVAAGGVTAVELMCGDSVDGWRRALTGAVSR
jgi:3-oxoacyl-[acyl-carrier-protein] synthase II